MTEKTNYISIGEVAKLIERTPMTIKNWYEWAEKHDQLDKLPKYRTDLSERKTRYFDENDVPKLIEFRDSISYGKMSDISRTKWGKTMARQKETKEKTE